jgi:hypothetical protein
METIRCGPSDANMFVAYPKKNSPMHHAEITLLKVDRRFPLTGIAIPYLQV